MGFGVRVQVRHRRCCHRLPAIRLRSEREGLAVEQAPVQQFAQLRLRDSVQSGLYEVRLGFVALSGRTPERGLRELVLFGDRYQVQSAIVERCAVWYGRQTEFDREHTHREQRPTGLFDEQIQARTTGGLQST